MEEKPEKPKKKQEEKHPLSETIESLKQNQKVESILSYAKSNSQEAIAYALMLVGIVWMFFNAFYGGILVGLIAAFFYSKEIILFIKNIEDFYHEEGIAKSVIGGGCLLALFFAAPGIFLGAGVMIGIKLLLKQA